MISARHRVLLAAAAAAALVLSGCSDDIDGVAGPKPDAAVVATPTPSAAGLAEFCTAKIAVDKAIFDTDAGPGGPESPSPAQIGETLRAAFTAPYAELVRTAQAEVSAPVTEINRLVQAAITAGDEEFFLAPEFLAPEKVIDEYLVANCAFGALSATAADYEFSGVPTQIPAGPTAVTLTNEGEEFHEIVLLRINDDVTLSPEEILALPEEEAMTKVTPGPPAALVLAKPGETATWFWDLPDGRYVLTCFIGKDSDAEHDFNGDGPPHFTEGMIEELLVGDATTPAATPTAGATGSSPESSSAASTEPTTTATP
ncbi:MAG: hypothetical protein ACT4PP_08930 [Sporichthyaceae bacterium]